MMCFLDDSQNQEFTPGISNSLDHVLAMMHFLNKFKSAFPFIKKILYQEIGETRQIEQLSGGKGGRTGLLET
jgi:hypothetical protein